MPKSKISKKRMFRDFAVQDSKYIKRNYLKNFKKVKHKMIESSGLRFSHIEFLLWGYDLQFFTIDYASRELDMNKTNLSNRVIYPLQKKGYLYKHFDKLTPSQTLEVHLFRDETKMNYRVRYALSQKGRLAVQRYYNLL